jgi:short-subunit dehydrogenase
VIANAGVSTGTLGESKLEDSTHALFEINVNGVFNTIFPLLARMRERKRGQVGLMSSLASFVPLPVACEYHASKAAVRFFAEGLRPLCAPDNVGVTALCPGFVRTPLTDITRRNNRSLPFFIDNAAIAADIMRDALERNVGVCVFPNALYLLSSLGSWLPLVVRAVRGGLWVPSGIFRLILDGNIDYIFIFITIGFWSLFSFFM